MITFTYCDAEKEEKKKHEGNDTGGVNTVISVALLVLKPQSEIDFGIEQHRTRTQQMNQET